MKTGIVWEGGAFRTMFSEGVNCALHEAGVGFDYAVGVSAGITFGVSFLSGQPRRNLEVLTRYVNDPRYISRRNLLDPTNRSYFGLHFVYHTIPNELVPFDYEAFAAWPGVAEAVVTDLNTGEAAYLPVRRDQRGFRVLQASCSLPLLFPVVRLNGVPCLDGGLADAIPFRRALEQGCDRVVVVLTRERGYWKKPDKNMIRLIRQIYRQYPNLVALIERQAERYNKLREELFRLEQEGRVMVVAPETTAGFKRLEKDVEKIRDLYQQGYDVAREQMGAIKAYLAGD